MAFNQEALGKNHPDRYDPPPPAGPAMSVERPFQLSVRKADWRQLAVVELPLLALLAMLFAVTFLFTPGLKMSLLGLDIPNVVLCPVLALTGVPCLMCGITRSFLSMGGGDITGAFVFHPLGPVFYLMLAGLFLVTLFSIVTRKQFRVSLSRGLRRNLIWGGTAIILAAWLVKVVIWYQVGLL
ncbi:MAG TPA: DUF2752 domain-containing protein [Actinobacteria bacterium]|nr:DUF2752 domain-containing protein [Actinomycetota bacterium]